MDNSNTFHALDILSDCYKCTELLNHKPWRLFFYMRSHFEITAPTRGRHGALKPLRLSHKFKAQ